MMAPVRLAFVPIGTHIGNLFGGFNALDLITYCALL